MWCIRSRARYRPARKSKDSRIGSEPCTVARRTRVTPEIAQDRFHDHERILQAVVAHSPEAAAKAMEEHIEKGYQILSASGLNKETMTKG